MNKKILIPAVGLTALIGAAVLGTNIVKADDNSYPPFVQQLSERFNLNEEEVKTFFDENREQRHEEMQANREEKLQQAVADGVLTQEQKDALEAKHEEMKANRQQHREEMDAWFESQGIDHDALMQYMGGPGPKGFGHGPM